MLPLLSAKEITVIFANIEDILLTNTVSLSLLLLVRVFNVRATGLPELS
jgi:hypothetical protein